MDSQSKKLRPIRQGSIYWLKDCDPLDDDNTKDRPVVVVEDAATLKISQFVMVIACTTKSRSSEYDQIQRPDRGSIPQTKSGLDKVCWAILRWGMPVHRDRLVEYKGHLTGKVLRAVIRAYLARVMPKIDD